MYPALLSWRTRGIAAALLFWWFWAPAWATSSWSLLAQQQGTPAALHLSATLTVADADRGQNGTVYVAALLPTGQLFTLGNGAWSPGLVPNFQGTLGTHALSVFSGLNLTGLAGTQIFAGYGRDLQDMLDRQQFQLFANIAGSMSGPATAGDWLTFSLNVQDFAYPDLSAATVDRVVTLHERYQVPLDVYLTDWSLASLETTYPAVLTRLLGSPYVALNYHVRPPKPYYTGYDWSGLGQLSGTEQRASILNYESHVTDLSTGQPTSAAGGFARLKQLVGPSSATIASLQADQALYASVSQVFKELGANMTVSHAAPFINLGTQSQGLALRPEHADLRLYDNQDQSAASVIEAAFAQAHAAVGAASPYVVGIKMHDNDFFASASAWTTTYAHKLTARPWDLSQRAQPKTEAQSQALWTRYETALQWAQDQRARIAVLNAKALAAALSVAAPQPSLLIAGTMHIESSSERWPDITQLLAFFARATQAGKVGAQTSGMRWSIGADIGWLNNEPRAAEAIQALSAMGVEWDIHAHNIADRAAVSERLTALGAQPNQVASGQKAGELDILRNAQTTRQGHTWQATSVWGLAREGSHTGGSEDLSYGLWQPLSNTDWQAHDPSAERLVIIGGGARTLDSARSLANSLTRGGYTAPIYSATIMVDQLTLTVSDAVNASTSHDGIEQIEAFAASLGTMAHVRWASLSQTAAAWRAAGAIPSRVGNVQ